MAKANIENSALTPPIVCQDNQWLTSAQTQVMSADDLRSFAIVELARKGRCSVTVEKGKPTCHELSNADLARVCQDRVVPLTSPAPVQQDVPDDKDSQLWKEEKEGWTFWHWWKNYGPGRELNATSQHVGRERGVYDAPQPGPEVRGRVKISMQKRENSCQLALNYCTGVQAQRRAILLPHRQALRHFLPRVHRPAWRVRVPRRQHLRGAKSVCWSAAAAAAATTTTATADGSSTSFASSPSPSSN